MINRLVNRLTFPTCHVVVCEDDLLNQTQIAEHLFKLFGAQGQVQVSIVPGAVMAAAVIEKAGVELILLDHDMPFGNWIDLLEWLNSLAGGHRKVPVITFSGIQSNNEALMRAGACHKFSKEEVFRGLADTLILEILGLERAIPR